jgi:DNA-binding ferritin-like protein (Dps family)
MARTTIPSEQDWETLQRAEKLIDDFEEAVKELEQNTWTPFIEQMKSLSWF